MKNNIKYPVETDDSKTRRLRIAPYWDQYKWSQVAGLVNLTHFIRSELGYNKKLKLVEIGSHMGESASIFCSSGLFSEVFLIDGWWNPFAEYVCKDNMKMFEKDIKITLVKGHCDNIYKNWDTMVDVAYIDADHTYDQVVKDISFWKSYVRKGGIICGHDYADNSFPEVVEAVNKFFNKSSIFTFLDKSWAVKI